MNRAEFQTFLTSLDQVAEVLGTTLSGTKKEGYWFALQDLSLEAFQGACMTVMRDETFFPVPAIFRAYAKEWLQKNRLLQAKPANGDNLLAIREELISHEEIRELIEPILSKEIPSQELLPPRRLHLTHNELHYEPTVDPDTAKAKLRAQAQQLQDEERRDDGTPASSDR